jgi:hypothetical protein
VSAVALVACGLLALGCGYNLVGKGSTLPADVEQIYVAPLENRTLRSQVDQILTAAITEEFVKRQRYDVVNSRDEADAEIVGSVTGFGATAVAFDANNRAERYEISITAALRLQRTTTPPELLWASDHYVFRRQYQAGEEQASAEVFLDLQSQAMEEVAQEFAQTLIIDVLEGF